MSLRIVPAPSPNFDERAFPLDMLVLHYTGMKDGPSALARMRDPESRVSAHYMVEEDGTVFSLVDEDKRAWQAGRSWWQGDEDLNSRSIGIEIVNGGHEYGLPPFPGLQIDVVIELCRTSNIPCVEKTLQRHDLYIADECFLTGSAAEVVPATKIDGRPIGAGDVGPITRRLMDAFGRHVRSV